MIPVPVVVPVLPPIKTPIFTEEEHSIVCFGEKVKLKRFNATRQYHLDSVGAIELFKASDEHEELMLDLSSLNEILSTFTTKIIERLPYFLNSILPQENPEIMPGMHWHSNSFVSKSLNIAILTELSGHFCHRSHDKMAHDIFLEYKEGNL